MIVLCGAALESARRGDELRWARGGLRSRRLKALAATAVRVRYSRNLGALVLERGRARFSVAKNPLKPFTVTAAGKTVVAVGAEFSVERLGGPGGGQVRMILYEGKVSVLAARSGSADPPPSWTA